jgi:hypothetical protein
VNVTRSRRRHFVALRPGGRPVVSALYLREGSASLSAIQTTPSPLGNTDHIPHFVETTHIDMHKEHEIASVLHIGIITGAFRNVLQVGNFVGICVIKREQN